MELRTGRLAATIRANTLLDTAALKQEPHRASCKIHEAAKIRDERLAEADMTGTDRLPP